MLVFSLAFLLAIAQTGQQLPDEERERNLNAVLLVGAAEAGHLWQVKELLANGVPIDARSVGGGRTALIAAASAYQGAASRRNRIHEVIEYLVSAGANIDLADDSGNTALAHAAGEGHVGTTLLLLKLGASVEASDTSGSSLTLIMHALHAHGPDAVTLIPILVNHGAAINGRNKAGFTPLLFELYVYARSDVVTVLLENGADANIALDEITPLMVAAHKCYVEVIQALMTHGAKKDARDKEGATALRYAKEAGCDSEVRRLLRKH